MNFQAHLGNAFEIMKREFVVFFLGGLLIQLLTALSLGLLAGPLMGGYLLLLVLWFREGKKPVLNDLFNGMQRFGALFPLLFLGVLIFCGFMLFVLPGVVFMTWWIYTVFLMADRNMKLGEAMTASKDRVNERGFFMHLVFLFMISVVPIALITMISALIPPLAALQYFLFPLQAACQASLYLEQVDGLDPANCFRAGKRAEQISHEPSPPPPPAAAD